MEPTASTMVAASRSAAIRAVEKEQWLVTFMELKQLLADTDSFKAGITMATVSAGTLATITIITMAVVPMPGTAMVIMATMTVATNTHIENLANIMVILESEPNKVLKLELKLAFTEVHKTIVELTHKSIVVG